MDTFRVRLGTSKIKQKKPKLLIEHVENGMVLRQFTMTVDEAIHLANDILALANSKPEVVSVILK